MLRVILVEDQSLVRASLANIVVSYGLQLVAEGALGCEVLGLVEKHHPDIVLLDLALPDLDGVQVLRQLRIHGYRTPVLIITGAGTSFRLRSSLEAGANGFLCKTASHEELLSAIRTVAGGGMHIPPGIARDSCGYISPRQQEILEGVTYGLTNDQIAARLYVSRGTVKLEINNLFQILKCRDRTHLACEAAMQCLVTIPRETHPLYSGAL